MKIFDLNLLMLITFLVILMIDQMQCEQIRRYECSIENNRFSYGYLLGSKDTFANSNVSIMDQEHNKHRVYVSPQVTVDELDYIKWIFIQTKNSYDTYYLKNKQTGEYLCSEDRVQSKSQKRATYLKYVSSDLRKIIKKELGNDCLWKFSRVESETRSIAYLIFNVLYNETLFGGWSKHGRLGRRYVYSWNKTPNLDEFKWAVDC